MEGKRFQDQIIFRIEKIRTNTLPCKVKILSKT